MLIMEEEESSTKLLHAVDIRTAKRKRRLQPVGEIIGTWGLRLLSKISPHNPRYPGRYSVAGWPVATTWCIHFCHDDLL